MKIIGSSIPYAPNPIPLIFITASNNTSELSGDLCKTEMPIFRFNASSQINNQIKLTYYDDKKEMALDSQTVRAKEKPKLNLGGLSQRLIYTYERFLSVSSLSPRTGPPSCI